MTRNHGYAYRERVLRTGNTVLEHLAATYRHSSAGLWRERIARGEVELDGRTAAPDTLLALGQELVWHRPPWDEPDADLDFQVLHEDAELVAVVKPRGLPTLPGAGYVENTLLARVRARFPDASPMHRLGRWTSGIVLFARCHEAGAQLQAAWREGRVEKTYRALGQGVADRDTFVVEAPIGPVPHPLLGSVHAAWPGGRPSRSRVRVLERRPGATLFEVIIDTGRPHQIRIHLAWAGHPLVGDPLYGPGGVPRPDTPARPGDGGYCLHAARLAFPHPATGRPLVLWATPPPELLAAGEG